MTVTALELDRFKQLIKSEFGLDFYHKNESVLSKDILKRIIICQPSICQPSLAGNTQYEELDGQMLNNYFRKLEGETAERIALAGLLTNNETYFFREPKHFSFLCDTLVPKILSQRQDNSPIRILSIGCSTGAEPYSIAIGLEQKYGSAAAQMFTIQGADIDVNVLDTARSGRYRSMEFRAIDAKIQERYFSQNSDGLYLLSERIKGMVSFHYLNVVSDDVGPLFEPVDIIFFRNVSIYFDAATRLAIQKKLIKLLNPVGYLIVGMTESMSNDFGLLSLNSRGSVFYFQKGDTSKPQAELQHPNENLKEAISHNSVDTPKVSHKLKTNGPDRNQLFKRTAGIIEHKKNNSENDDLMQQRDYDRALELLDGLVVDSHSTIKHFLLQSFILFNRQDFEHARDYALRALDMAPFNPDGFLLLGMISKWQGYTDDAMDWFKKALYIHSDCWPAHFYLAGLYQQKNITDKAIQEYRLVLQQLDEPEENYTARLTIPLSFNRADIQLLCRSHLQQIQSTQGSINGY